MLRVVLIVVFVIVALDVIDYLVITEQRLRALEGGAKVIKGPWPDLTVTARPDPKSPDGWSRPNEDNAS